MAKGELFPSDLQRNAIVINLSSPHSRGAPRGLAVQFPHHQALFLGFFSSDFDRSDERARKKRRVSSDICTPLFDFFTAFYYKGAHWFCALVIDNYTHTHTHTHTFL